jgi:quaternary ammonium compound-resistance protein SugE
MMAWLILVISGVFEAVWAIALGRSEGFTRLGPSIIFVVASLVSLTGLSIAMKELPVGTAYAVWVGVGVTITVVISMLSGQESASAIKVLLLAGIILCVAGLKVSA